MMIYKQYKRGVVTHQFQKYSGSQAQYHFPQGEVIFDIAATRFYFDNTKEYKLYIIYI
jgi:hypothetical protein